MPKELLLVSHGFQSHYELGVANGLAEQGVPVRLLGSDTTLVQRLHPGVRFQNLRGSQDEKRPRWAKAYCLLSYHLKLILLALLRPRHPIMIIGMLRPEWFVGLIECTLFRLTGRPLSLTVHNILPHDRHTRTMRRLYWLIYRLPSRLLVHTESTRAALIQEFGVRAEKILLVPHGLNDAVTPLPLPRAEAKLRLGLPGDARTLLFFGHVSPFKGVELLLDAFERMHDVTLLVAGRCTPDGYGNSIRARLEPLRERGRVLWFDGYVPEDVVASVFAAADLVVLPYRHIDQSGVLLQALSLGVPVAATRVGGFRELVNEHNGVFIDEVSADAIEAAVRRYFAREHPLERDEVRATVAPFAWRNTLRPFLQWLYPERFPVAGDGAGRPAGADEPHPLSCPPDPTMKPAQAQPDPSDPARMPALPKISFVICTKNRGRQLRSCLDRVAAMTVPFPWELILVDNASTDDTAAVMHEFLASFPGRGRYLLETRPGNGAGRNAAIQASAGEILAFTDDDCYVESDFLTEVAKVFEDPAVGYMSGRIMLFDPQDYRITVNESRETKLVPARKVVPAGLVQGANMAFRRTALMQAGLFDEDFGAGAKFAGEDWELAIRVSLAGWKGGYFPGPVVWHHHGRKAPEARKLSRFYTIGEGAVYAKGVLTSATRLRVALYWAKRLGGDLIKRRSAWRIGLVTLGAFQYTKWRLRPSHKTGTTP